MRPNSFTFLARTRLRPLAICCSKCWSSLRLMGSKSSPEKFLFDQCEECQNNLLIKENKPNNSNGIILVP